MKDRTHGIISDRVWNQRHDVTEKTLVLPKLRVEQELLGYIKGSPELYLQRLASGQLGERFMRKPGGGGGAVTGCRPLPFLQFNFEPESERDQACPALWPRASGCSSALWLVSTGCSDAAPPQPHRSPLHLVSLSVRLLRRNNNALLMSNNSEALITFSSLCPDDVQMLHPNIIFLQVILTFN